MDPDQKYSPEYLAENRSQQLIQLAVAFAVLETLLIGLYFTSRYIGRTVNSIDVYFMLPAYIMSMCQIIATFGQYLESAVYFKNILSLIYKSILEHWTLTSSLVEVRHAGVGRHMITLSMKQVILLLKFVIFEEFTYPVAIALPKLSILFLYLRIFTARSFRYTTFAILGVVVITYLTSLTLNFTLCIPFAYNWNKSIPGGHCADSIAAYRYISVPNIATDLAMLILPFPAIWNLHASKMQKTGLTIIFLAGSVWVITSWTQMSSMGLISFLILVELLPVSSVLSFLLLSTLPKTYPGTGLKHTLGASLSRASTSSPHAYFLFVHSSKMSSRIWISVAFTPVSSVIYPGFQSSAKPKTSHCRL